MNQAADQQREFRFTDRDFNYLRRLVSDKVGIELADSKRQLVYGRLTKRLRQLNMREFRDYCRHLESSPGEITNLINSITTNLTAFFREKHHFEFLADQIIKTKQNKRDQTLSIWSAGCSTGEEPYSIAMTIYENIQNPKAWKLKLLASDVDSNVLATAQAGVYAEDRVKDMDEALLYKWFLKGKGTKFGKVRVCSELRHMWRFFTLNLHSEWRVSGPLDAIFCRNVMIYFNKEKQKVIVDRFADVLAPGGYLIIGHSESLFKVSDRFKSLGKTIYQKTK